MKVSQIMQSEVVTVKKNLTVTELVAVLSHHKITGAPVVDNEGRLEGVVSLSDIVRNSARGQRPQEVEYYVNPSWGYLELMDQDDSSQLVSDIMTSLVLDIEENAEVERAAELMANFRIHRVIVTRDKKVVGVLSSLDLVTVLRDLLKGK